MEIKLLPTWMFRRHLKIWREKRDSPTTFQECTRLLPDDKKVVAVFLSKLHKCGWVDIQKDPQDGRRKLYVFHDPKKNIEKCTVVV